MKILACIDVSVYAESVADHAAWAAGRMDASVTLLHVIGRKERGELYDISGALGPDAGAALLTQLAEADAMSARLARDRGKALLDAMNQRLQAASVRTGPPVLRDGSFVDTVTEVEADCDLVVVGKRGANADFATLHLGSNLERVVRSSGKPVLVASRAFRPVKRALIAYDGGPSARKAVDAVAEQPLFRDLSIHIVRVGEDTLDARDGLEAAAAVLRQSGLTVEASIRPGDPDRVIGDIVRNEGVDLLVMGAYGHSRVRHLLVGSTTSAMVRTCLIPVMLFR